MRTSHRSGLLLYLAGIGLPIGLGLGYALLYSLGIIGYNSEGFTVAHWKRVLGGEVFWSSLGFSAWIAFCSMVLAAGGALWIVLSWRKQLRQGWLSRLMYVPLTLPAVVVAFYVFQLLSRGGLLSRLSLHSGIIGRMEAFPEFVNEPWGIGIIFAHVFMAMPFFSLLFSSIYEAEKLDTFSEVAVGLGADNRQVRWRIIVPMLWRRSFPTLLLYFIFVLSSYEIPLLLGSRSREMISVLTIQKLQRFNLLDIPQAYAISVLYSIIVIALVIIFLGPALRRTGAKTLKSPGDA